jgi:hypothetical protein
MEFCAQRKGRRNIPKGSQRARQRRSSRHHSANWALVTRQPGNLYERRNAWWRREACLLDELQYFIASNTSVSRIRNPADGRVASAPHEIKMLDLPDTGASGAGARHRVEAQRRSATSSLCGLLRSRTAIPASPTHRTMPRDFDSLASVKTNSSFRQTSLNSLSHSRVRWPRMV